MHIERYYLKEEKERIHRIEEEAIRERNMLDGEGLEAIERETVRMADEVMARGQRMRDRLWTATNKRKKAHFAEASRAFLQMAEQLQLDIVIDSDMENHAEVVVYFDVLLLAQEERDFLKLLSEADEVSISAGRDRIKISAQFSLADKIYIEPGYDI